MENIDIKKVIIILGIPAILIIGYVIFYSSQVKTEVPLLMN